MKTILTFLILAFAISVFGQSGENAAKQEQSNDSLISNPLFDKALAEKLGADDYGMKSYFFVLLKTGSNTNTDVELRNEAFKGHMANISKLVKEGTLIIAGPFGKNDLNYRGIFIFNNVNTKEEAEQLLFNDPAITNGYLAYEIIGWYGSAAIPEYLPASDKIWKTGF